MSDKATETKETLKALGLQEQTADRFDEIIKEQIAARQQNDFTLLNKDCFYRTATEIVFVTETEFDALGIIDTGVEAVALGHADAWESLVNMLEAREPLCKNISIALNTNTAAGKEAAECLKMHLDKLGLICDIADFQSGDILALIQNGQRQEASDKLADAIKKVFDKEQALADAARAEIRRDSVSNRLDRFKADIEEASKKEVIKTGYKQLDNLLEGGLYTGLYIIGAISSLGKTTYCLQMAEQIAASGRDVLIFSLEMEQNELIAKSISREMFKQVMRTERTDKHALTTRNILAGRRYIAGQFESFSEKENYYLNAAIEAYKPAAEHIYIQEGNSQTSVESIREIIQRHVSIMGVAPVVVIDYLQILAPSDPRATDKQNIDRAITALKQISRDFKTPVIGISSFNRGNYNEELNFAAFKESGTIEYSADVLIGLRYDRLETSAQDSDAKQIQADNEAAARAGKYQKIKVKIMKNRNGTKGEYNIAFFPMFNYFTEWKPAAETPFKDEKPKQATFEQTAIDLNDIPF